ncbi:7-dehydrocholesterol reductase isoform X1 [Ixodes scapularis]
MSRHDLGRASAGRNQKSMEEAPPSFVSGTLIPLFLMLLTPNIVVCGIYFVVVYGSSIAEVSKIGFLTFWYDSWTARGLGTYETWLFLLLFIAYSGLSLVILPGKVYYGPPTSSGHRPLYSRTGVLYYTLTMGITSYLILYQDVRCWSIYRSLPDAAVAMTLVGFVVSSLLFIKGHVSPCPGESGSSGNIIFDFYWGMELYPRLGKHLDVKQWTNCRFGMMLWQLMVLISWKAQVEDSGWNWSMAATAILQTVYIAKFYWWEDGYMTSIDIIVDRAGYYICWGCICFLGLLYGLTSLYMVENSPESSAAFGVGDIAFGLVMIGCNYWCDYQRQVARASNGKCNIWGSPARVIKASYRDLYGRQKTNLLLVSGFWSLSRHMNYIFEILCAVSWAIPAGASSIVPYLYLLYLTGLLVHRSYRDERKCSMKYNQFWTQYKSLVKYQLIPYVL